MQADFIAKRIIEGILFLSPNPLSIRDIAKVTGFKPSLISICLKELVDDYETRGVNVKAVAGAFQMVTPADLAPYVEKFASYTKGISLSRPAMETLAIIAYRQPVTRSEVEEVRGVNIDGVLNKLLDLKVVRILGRSDKPGRPVLFGTSREFLRVFGMESLDDLPKLDNAPVRNAEKMVEVFNEDDDENNVVGNAETVEAVMSDAVTANPGIPVDTIEAITGETGEIVFETPPETAGAAMTKTGEITTLEVSMENFEGIESDTTEIAACEIPVETVEAAVSDSIITATGEMSRDIVETIETDTSEFPVITDEIIKENED